MNVNFRKSATSLALSLIALSSPAFAVGADYDYPKTDAVASDKTRADVMAELAEAQARDEVRVADYSYPIVVSRPGTRLRAEVAAEAIEAARSEKLPFSLYSGS